MVKPPTPSPDAAFAHHCADLMAAAIGPVRARRMFGGWGFSCDGVSVALMADGVLFLKVDEQTQAQFESSGGQPFIHRTDDGRKFMQMSYWTVPEDALESPALMAPWARLALQAALRKANAKPVKKPAKSAAPKKPTVKSAATGLSTTQAATKSVATKRKATKTGSGGPRA